MSPKRLTTIINNSTYTNKAFEPFPSPKRASMVKRFQTIKFTRETEGTKTQLENPNSSLDEYNPIMKSKLNETDFNEEASLA